MSSLDPETLRELTDFALELAEASGPAILPHFRKNAEIENKNAADFDPVTAGDRDAEQVIRTMIEHHYPDHGIIGEEFGVKQGWSEWTWVLDPIDGTRSFISGAVMWTTLIGLLHGDKPVAGVMNQPYVRETFYADGQTAWCRRDGRDSALTVRPASSLSDATVTTTAPGLYRTPQERAFLADLQDTARLTRFDGDAYFYCLLAAGYIDVALDAGLQSYDIVALVPIIEAAGGIVTTWDRKPATNGGNIIAAASESLYEETLEVLARAGS